jgi:hypothetical protein
MEFLHQELDLGPNDLLEVILDNTANVLLLDPDNYTKYRNRQPYQYQGGYATHSPYHIQPPSPGRWHLVIDLGGNAGRVRAWSRILPAPEAVAG